MTRVCPQCSTPNAANAASCARCGFKFTSSAPTYPTPPQGYQQPQQGYQQGYQQPPQGYQQPQQGYPPQTPPPGFQPPSQWQSPPPGQYPTQPGTYPNAPTPRAKKGPGLWIAVALIVLLLAGGGYALYTFVLHGGSHDPGSVANAYCNDLKTNNYQDAYGLLSNKVKQKVTLQEMQLGFGLINSAGGIKSCTVSDVQVNGSNATAKITLTLGTGQAHTETQSLVLEDGSWKLGSSSGGGSQ